jgi:ATP:ADP antiporter, AAA family
MPRVLTRAGRALERAIGAEVHPGEWPLVRVFFLNLFLLLAAYYVLKVIREPLILLSGGAVERSLARGLQAGLLCLIIPIYSVLANRFEPARLVKWIMSAFVLCVLGFVALGQLGVSVGFAFFVWLGIFSTLAIAQFWSLATDVMTEAEGQRLFPLVAVGGTLGGILGAQLASRMSVGFHPFHLMLVAAAILIGCAGLTHWTHQAGEAHRARLPSGVIHERDRRGGFTLVVHDRYLGLIALSVLALNFVNTTGDFILADLVDTRAKTLPEDQQRAFIASFYGNYQTGISVLSALVQVFVVTRAFKRLGISGALLLLPVFAAFGYSLSALLPLLLLVATVKALENSTNYSLQNTLQQALFLPTSRDAKYKAKAAIDTLFVRLGDLASTAVVFVGAHLGLSTLGYGLVNVTASAAWIWLALRLGQLNLRRRACAPQGGEAQSMRAA